MSPDNSNTSGFLVSYVQQDLLTAQTIVESGEAAGSRR
jgi:hypothetical protein